MADLILIQELRAYLVAQGVVQNPPGDASLPVCWLDKWDGAPEPAGAVLQTVHLRATGHVVLPPMYEWLEERIVDVTVRATLSQDGELVQRRIKNLLNERFLLTLGDLQTEYIAVWRGVQPLGADKNSYTTMQSFRVQARVKALAGLPYVP